MQTFCNNNNNNNNNNKELTPENIRNALRIFLNKVDNEKYFNKNVCKEDKFKPKNIISYSTSPERKQMNDDNVWKD